VSAGHAWSATTTEGLLIYSLDQGLQFDPFFLDESITPESVKKTLKTKDWGKGMLFILYLSLENTRY
jgi:periodic tryptophan protein 2